MVQSFILLLGAIRSPLNHTEAVTLLQRSLIQGFLSQISELFQSFLKIFIADAAARLQEKSVWSERAAGF